MNAFYFTHRTTARFFAALAMFSLVMGMLPVQAFADDVEVPPADDTEQAPVPVPKPEVGKVKICHASNNGYDGGKKEVDKSSITKEAGHASHVTKAPDGLGDIIPPFGEFPGLNWDAEHQAIWNDNCEVPVVDVCPNIPKTQEAIPKGMVKNEEGECVTPAVECPFGEESGDDEECQGGGVCPPGTAGEYPICNDIPKKEVPVKITVCKEDETGAPLSGWVITVTNNTPDRTFKLTTESDGCVSRTVDAQNGPFYAYETMKAGWTQEEVMISPSSESALSGSVIADPNVSNTEMCKMNFAIMSPVAKSFGGAAAFIAPKIVAVPENYTCTFVNSEDDVPPPPVLGCTNEAATNYNPAATVGNLDAENCDFDLDVCPEMGGMQTSEESCPAVLDVCPNDAGIQTSLEQCSGDNTPKTCTVALVSDTSDFVIQKGANAKSLTFVHNAWTAVIAGATWIWGDDPVATPAVDETQTFQKKFGFSGIVTNATLELASDNDHSAVLNGQLAHTGGSTFDAPVSYNVTSEITQGNNELDISVKNTGVADSTFEGNPAGLKYKLTITGTPTGNNEGCEVPYVPPTIDEEILGCTDTDATNFNTEATVNDESCLYQTGGGGGGGNARRTPEGSVLGISDEIKPTGEVLGAQVTAIPAGAPDAGAGGTSPFSLGFVSIAPVAFLQRLRIHG